MEIFFEKAHSPRLLAALRCVHRLPPGDNFLIRYYDSTDVNDSNLDNPVIIWKAHYKGDADVKAFQEKGYRVVALRHAEGLGAFRTSLLPFWGCGQSCWR